MKYNNELLVTCSIELSLNVKIIFSCKQMETDVSHVHDCLKHFRVRDPTISEGSVSFKHLKYEKIK